jgi:hypothetical protein
MAVISSKGKSIHHIPEKGEFSAACGLYHPSNWTTSLSHVTCVKCCKALGIYPINKLSSKEHINDLESKLKSQEREIANLKKAIRNIMDICLEVLHGYKQD